MPAPRLLPDNAVLRQLRHEHAISWCPIRERVGCKGEPHSYNDIATAFGVTRGAVYLRLKDMDEVKPRARYTELIPWRVSQEHIHAYPAMMLRLLSRRIQGLKNPANKDKLLDRWLEDMREADTVVIYDPSIGPNQASQHGGWAYSRRRPEDGEFRPETGEGVIRPPEGD